jgi:transcriptional regulator with XRE-family HTH domain
LDLTQTELADCVGCTVATIRKIEGELRRPSRQIAELLAETITLAIRGRATAPSVTLTSSPTAMSQTEIVELLTYGQLRGDSRALVAAGSQFLARQLTREFPELTQTIGDIELGQRVTEGSATEEQGSQTFTTVGLTRYFTRDLLVRYSQVVGDVSQTTAVDYQDLTAEYRLNRLLFLSGQVTRRRGVLITSQDQTIYNLDVRARHEY